MKTANAALIALINGQKKAIQTNGVSNHALIPSTNALNPEIGTPFSIEFWFNPYSTQPYPLNPDLAVVEKWNNPSTSGDPYPYVFRWDKTLNRMSFARYNGTTSLGMSYTSSAMLDTWHHVVVTSTGSILNFYVDAILRGGPTAEHTGSVANNSNIYIGARSATENLFNGGVDELRIYTRALSAVEVAEHYAGIFRNESGLAGRWGFDENTGTTAFDLSGNGNNGTLVSAPTFVDFNPYPGSEQEYSVAELLTFTLVGGGILRYNLSDVDITSGGNLFSASGPLIKRGKIRNTVGMEVDTLGLAVNPKSTDLINGQAWVAAVMAGALDGAEVTLERAYMPSWGSAALGTLIMFTGRVAETRPSRSFIEVDVKSHLELLNIQMPRNLWQPGCVHTTFDSGCGLVKASFKSSTSVNAGSGTTVLNCGLVQAAGYFDLGTITFTSGPNNGVSRTVKSYTLGVITLLSALPNTPAVGNTFDAYPGDDKTQATCTNKFANKANFKATPYIPVAETAV